jgi:predicted nucleic acid-binding protein
MDIAFDTSLLVGLLDPQDLWHDQAVALEIALQSPGFQAVYFDCVIAETVSVATRRLRETKRFAEIGVVLDRIIASFPPGTITWIGADVPALQSDVLSLVRTSGGELNFNDALIALACQEREIGFIASFDRDFDQVSWLQRLADAGTVP